MDKRIDSIVEMCIIILVPVIEFEDPSHGKPGAVAGLVNELPKIKDISYHPDSIRNLKIALKNEIFPSALGEPGE